MDEQLKQKVETLYGVHILRTRKVRDITKLETDHGDLCLKGVDYKPEKLLYIYHAIEHLLKNGFCQLPAFIHTLTGDPYFTYNGEIFFITEWIPGRESNFKNLVDLELAVVSLARMHRATRGFHPPAGIKLKSRHGKWTDRFRDRTEELRHYKEMALQNPNPTDFDRYYLKHVDQEMEDCEKALHLLTEANYHEMAKKAKKDGGFCHNDYVYHNVMINDLEPNAYIIDFDYARHDVRVYDLARFMRRVIKKKDQQKDLLDVILSSYISEYPLEPREYTLLAAFIQFPQRFWRMADRYYNRKRDWSEKRYYRQLKRSIKRQRHQKKLVKEILHYEDRQT